MTRESDLELHLKQREAFAKFKGGPYFTQIDGIMAMNLGGAPVVIERVFNGNLVPWNQNQGEDRVRQLLGDPSSLYHRALAAALDNYDSEESRIIFRSLTTQAANFDAHTLIDSPQRLRERFNRLALLGEAYGMVCQKAEFEEQAFGEKQESPETTAFSATFKERAEQVREVIEQLDDKEIVFFVLLDDAIRRADEMTYNPSIRRRLRIQRDVPDELSNLMSAAYTAGFDLWRLDIKYFAMLDPLEPKWEQMQKNCGWNKVTDVINALPQIASGATYLRIIDGLEDSLETEMSGELDPQKLSAAGIVNLLHFDIAKNVSFSDNIMGGRWEEEGIETEVSFSNFSLPRELAPLTVIHLLSEIALKAESSSFEDLLTRVQVLVFRKTGSPFANINEWLLMLTLLQDSPDMAMKQKVRSFVDRKDFPHEQFRDVLLNRKPGKIWLLDNGNIRVTDGTLSNAHCIYTSTFVVPEKSAVSPRVSSLPTVEVAPQPISQPRSAPEAVTKTPKKQPLRVLTPIQQVLESEVALNQSIARPSTRVVLPPGKSLRDLGEEISLVDLGIVEKAIELSQLGHRRIEPLRVRTEEGKTLYKMRVNGKDSGIRILMTHVRNNVFRILRIGYRGNVYKDI